MKSWIITPLLCSGALLGASVAMAQKIGINAVVVNDVKIKTEADTDARAAATGDDVALGDTITSGDESSLQVMLLDETTFAVSANAELVVDKFVYDPDRGTGEMAASVAKGAFRFMSGRTARNPRNVEIDTPVASMGIRGTIVEGAVGREAVERLSGLENQFEQVNVTQDATLIVLRGPSAESEALNRTGEVTVTTRFGSRTLTTPNSAVFIPGPDTPIIGPFPLPKQTVASFGQAITKEPTGQSVNPVPSIEIQPVQQLEEVPLPPLPEPEEEQVIDRPTIDCPVIDAVPITDGGLILDQDPTQLFDDFGTIELGVACLE